jgi:hypothetical protein
MNDSFQRVGRLNFTLRDADAFNMSFGIETPRIGTAKRRSEFFEEDEGAYSRLHGSEMDATEYDLRRANFVDLFLSGTEVDKFIIENMYGKTGSELG